MKIKELLSKASQDIFQYVSQFHQLYSKELSLVLYDTPNNELTFLFAKQKKHKKKFLTVLSVYSMCSTIASF